MPEVPANHRSTDLAEVLFPDFVSCPHSDLYGPYIRIAWRTVFGIRPQFGGGGWSHTACRLPPPPMPTHNNPTPAPSPPPTPAHAHAPSLRDCSTCGHGSRERGKGVPSCAGTDSHAACSSRRVQQPGPRGYGSFGRGSVPVRSLPPLSGEPPPLALSPGYLRFFDGTD